MQTHDRFPFRFGENRLDLFGRVRAAVALYVVGAGAAARAGVGSGGGRRYVESLAVVSAVSRAGFGASRAGPVGPGTRSTVNSRANFPSFVGTRSRVYARRLLRCKVAEAPRRPLGNGRQIAGSLDDFGRFFRFGRRRARRRSVFAVVF